MTSESLLHQAGLCLQNGDLGQAEYLYRQVIQHKPFSFEAHVQLAVILAWRGQMQEAAHAFERALRFKSDNAMVLFNYGNVLSALRRPDDALANYDKALAIAPHFSDALTGRAAALNALGRFQEALISVDRAIVLKPANALAHHNRGVALAGLKRFDQAVAAYDAALALASNLAETWNNRGIALSELQRFSEAIESYDRALSLDPGRADTYISRGCALGEIERFAQALASHDKALSLNPSSADALYNRGLVLREMKRIEEAVQSYRQCVALEPDYANALHNLGHCLLQLGRLEEGFRLYETRALTWPFHYPQPSWSGGEDIPGKTLLVRAEGGFGDIIHFSRYLPHLEDKGIKVILEVQDKLIRLLKSSPRAVEIIGLDGPAPDFDYQVRLQSLPLAFGTVLESIPADIPYLAAEPELVGKWKDRIGDAGFKIGIAWQCSPAGEAIGRGYPVSQYARLSKIPGVRLISLQRHDAAAPLSDFALEQLGAEFDGGADAFIDSAAVMQCLDLVITPDTAIAHLAGALGRPVWVALKYVPDWRWLLDRSDTPWYPTMRLFRQPAPGDWDGLFVQMQTELAAVAGTCSKTR
jgi:tetratricopeptide (TPR) repeat protein